MNNKGFNAEQLLETQFHDVAAAIKEKAHKIHADVNQKYDGKHPYSYHLDSVVDAMMRHVGEVLASPDDLIAVYFGAYFHDSIEDARLTYRDVLSIADSLMNHQQALAGTEIAYALTNEKGRTRAERANSKYYEEIRETPYAPMVKLADRIANMSYSFHHNGGPNNAMRETYSRELPHFLESLRSPHAETDSRYLLPQAMVEELTSLLD